MVTKVRAEFLLYKTWEEQQDIVVATSYFCLPFLSSIPGRLNDVDIIFLQSEKEIRSRRDDRSSAPLVLNK